MERFYFQAVDDPEMPDIRSRKNFARFDRRGGDQSIGKVEAVGMRVFLDQRQRLFSDGFAERQNFKTKAMQSCADGAHFGLGTASLENLHHAHD